MSNRHVPRYLIGTDVETSGTNVPGRIGPDQTPSQCLSIGIIIIDTQHPDLPEVGCFYREIRFDENNFLWEDWTTEKHGFTQEILASKPHMANVATEVYCFLTRFINPHEPQVLMAHNPGFDRGFLLQVLAAGGYNLNLSYRMVDSFSLGWGHYGLHNTDEQFAFMGVPRGDHNALEDIRLVAEMLRLVRNAGNRKLVRAGRPPAGLPPYAVPFVEDYLKRRQQCLVGVGPQFMGLAIWTCDGKRQYAWYYRESQGEPDLELVSSAYTSTIDRMLDDRLLDAPHPPVPGPDGGVFQAFKASFLQNIER